MNYNRALIEAEATASREWAMTSIINRTLRRLWQLHNTIFAITLAFASVVEWAHFRRFLAKRDWRAATTLAAAIASGYMASEALEGDWPSWRGHGYD